VLGLSDSLPDGRIRALSGNFIDMALQARAEDCVNRLIRARITEVTPTRVSAIPC
jgi:hypothetical protein